MNENQNPAEHSPTPSPDRATATQARRFIKVYKALIAIW